MFSLEIIIPIIVVAAVCAVYIILRGRRDERRAREAGEKLRPIPMDDPLVAGGAAMRPAPDAPAPKPAASAAAPMEPVFNPDAAKPSKDSELFEPQSPSDEPPIYRQLKPRKKRSALLTRRKLRPPLKLRNPRAVSAIRQSPRSTA